MQLIIWGYGKMGRAIERIAKEKGHHIACIVADENAPRPSDDLLRNSVVVECTAPDQAFDNVRYCLERGARVVCGTTGWTDQIPEAEKLCLQHGGALIVASNFSLGVNLFFILNEYAAKLMAAHHADYQVIIEETHHTQKLDAPSGTALTLSTPVLQARGLNYWKKYAVAEPIASKPDTLPIRYRREGDTIGTHEIQYVGEMDEITLRHTAKNRDAFAGGAVRAAEFLAHKKGVFTMRDVLGVSAHK